jgi:alpha-L-rhamnosidase
MQVGTWLAGAAPGAILGSSMVTRREVLRGTGNLLAAAALPAIVPRESHAQSAAPAATPQQARFVAIAESLKPALHEEIQRPFAVVNPVADASIYLRWRMEVVSPAAALEDQTFRPGDQFILDFGHHRTGYLSFSLSGVGRNVDAPARLRFTFGEVPGDVAEPLHPYKGTLGEGWLPEDTVTIDYLPQTVRLPRRYAFRYVKVEILGTSPSYAAQFRDIRAHAVTSAVQTPPPLPASASDSLRAIDAASLATLRDCMQTTFEDGPRRDQRLWIGDMRLQALANYKTFRNFPLVKRCLYLFAAFPREDGLLHACVFEKPHPLAAGDTILDYAALYVAALYDYVLASGDKACGRDLWPTAQRQLEIVGACVNKDGLFVDPHNIWIFIDWAQKLDRTAAMHGVLLYSYRQAAALATLLGHTGDATRYSQIAGRMKTAAQQVYFDSEKQLYTSGLERQVSLATQAWLILAGVPTTEAAATALRKALADPAAVVPASPYLQHHVVSAMLACGMQTEALALIDQYWGGMIQRGADTFWEIYNPDDSLASPYNDIHINSFCHAWSCTPAYLLRTVNA